GLEGSTYANQLVVGEPLNINKLYRLDGVDPETGLYTFHDFNGDGEISAVDDKQILKTLNPQYYGGMNNRLSFGKFNLDVLLQFSKLMGWNYWRYGSIPGSMRNLPKEIMGRWHIEGDFATSQWLLLGSSLE